MIIFVDLTVLLVTYGAYLLLCAGRRSALMRTRSKNVLSFSQGRLKERLALIYGIVCGCGNDSGSCENCVFLFILYKVKRIACSANKELVVSKYISDNITAVYLNINVMVIGS